MLFVAVSHGLHLACYRGFGATLITSEIVLRVSSITLRSSANPHLS